MKWLRSLSRPPMWWGMNPLVCLGPGEEHGSARWGNPRQPDRKYRNNGPKCNAILTWRL
ncbi:MAG: hypothetical protein HFF18_04105 [Oscillospiraceae bacterium]|nr:hypothetical protein [Oscillospiraceae bacterium]